MQNIPGFLRFKPAIYRVAASGELPPFATAPVRQRPPIDLVESTGLRGPQRIGSAFVKRDCT
jgi:hypothetical protein